MPVEGIRTEEESLIRRKKLHSFVSKLRIVLNYKASDRTNHNLQVCAKVPRQNTASNTE